MDATAQSGPSEPPSASATRSLRVAIDGTPERLDPGRVREMTTAPLDPTEVRSLHSTWQTSIQAGGFQACCAVGNAGQGSSIHEHRSE
eukprot:4323763-Pleurochrysis_carterae.AAC.1